MEVFNNLCQAIQENLGSCFRPNIGRFASADTIVPDAANPQSHNRYSYALNRPYFFIDPTGHVAEDANNGSTYCSQGYDRECWADDHEMSEVNQWLYDMDLLWKDIMLEKYIWMFDVFNDLEVGPIELTLEGFTAFAKHIGASDDAIDFVGRLGKNAGGLGKMMGGADFSVRMLAIYQAYANTDYRNKSGNMIIDIGIRELNYLTFRAQAGYSAGIGLDIASGAAIASGTPIGWATAAGLVGHDITSTLNGKSGFDEHIGQFAAEWYFGNRILDANQHTRINNTIPTQETALIISFAP